MRATGVAKDNWTVSGHRRTICRNSNASQFTSTGQFIESEVPVRPRTVMFQMNMKFGGETPAAPTPPPGGCAAAAAASAATATAAAASAAAPAASAGAGGSAPGRDLRDELGEAAAGIGLDSGRRRHADRALPLLARRHSRLHRFRRQARVQPEAVRAARERRQGLPRGARRAQRVS